MWIRTRMILYFEKFWPSDPKVVAEGAAGVQAPLEEEQLRIILIGHVKKSASIWAAFWLLQFTFTPIVPTGHSYS